MTRKPCDKELAAELVTAVKEIYTGDIPVTVNGVRQRAEEKLDLDKGFFKQESWKDRSKQIIKDVVAKLDSGEAVTPSPTVPKPLKGQKRASQADAEEQTPTPNKRQRKQPPSAKAKADETDPSETPAKKRSRKPEARAKRQEDSELCEPGEESEAHQPARKKQKAERDKPIPRKKARAAKADSDVELSEDDEDEPKPVKKRTQRRKSAVKKSSVESDASDQSDADEQQAKDKGPVRRGGSKSAKVVELEEDEDEEPAEQEDKQPELDSELSEIDETPSSSRRRGSKNDIAKDAEHQSVVPEDEDNEDGAGDKTADVREDSDTEHSIVFDEPPKRKRGRKSKEASDKPAAKSKAKGAAELTPEQEEIKKLQGQLLKCGVRKVWGNILKKYGDDNRAKIRHLRDMLKEIGMEGRFSDAKARQIKEQRELQAELEAVKEFQDHWGKGDSGRASRSRAARPKKSLKVDDDSDDNGGEEDETAENGADSEDEDEDEDEGPTHKRAKAMAKRRADFAFLGDEEESD
ncbi:hypothetical protein DL546_003109 [Coniochaeta pulveracea]|uniref:Transcriptional regulator n=1 Tax=Coniochaeta pulveracea TaxID=177199 RepID=A0A420Y5D3_9PEZI|nr:hypothetical protein DL546_003109 [Coniochaeta pulveracea]